MSYEEIKRVILFHYNENIDYWHNLVGEMFEATDGFTKHGEVKRNLDGKKCIIIWDNYSWNINE